MQITIDIPDEIATNIRAHGETPETFVAKLVAEHAAKPRGYGANGLLTYEEFQAGLDRMTRFSAKIPDLPDEAFSRESFYSDHD
jgi:hypothetical protein